MGWAKELLAEQEAEGGFDDLVFAFEAEDDITWTDWQYDFLSSVTKRKYETLTDKQKFWIGRIWQDYIDQKHMIHAMSKD